MYLDLLFQGEGELDWGNYESGEFFQRRGISVVWATFTDIITCRTETWK